MKGTGPAGWKEDFCRRALICAWIVGLAFLFAFPAPSRSADLKEIQERGVLLHLGIPYANFVTGGGDGLDVDLMKLFAQSIGVEYRYVPSSWMDAISELVGKRISSEGGTVKVVGEVPVKGDVIASGLTVLPWREKVVAFSRPTFLTQVWLLARHDSTIAPISPSEDVDRDIASVKSLLKGHEVLGVNDTCLDPALYRLAETGAKARYFTGKLNELAPALINGEAELTLFEMPDAFVALEKWPGKLKVIGPISPVQEMACAFPKTSEKLLQRFNEFYEQIRKDGTYLKMVRKYYPTAPDRFPDFFKTLPVKP